ncbi:MAG TPA: outer membrane beta-barrel protein [Polyangia bacterium]|nr:outer membrane beta-barrel protein [Polyangia bacterium]
MAAPAPAAAPAAPPAKTWKDLITIDGLVDSYYLINMSGTGTHSSLVPPVGRQFDTNSNTFTLNYAKVGIGMSADNVALRMDLGYGSMGNIINGTNQPFVAEQAFMSVTALPNFTIDFGKFATTAGAEVIEAEKNWLYSRSFLFFNIPLVHTGLRLNYKVNDMVSVQGSLVNGWNGQGFEPDANAGKTIGLSATIAPNAALSIIPTIYWGSETAAGMAGTDYRFLGDLVAAYTMGPLGLNLNFDYVQDKDAGIDPFLGVAVMGHYTINDHVNATARAEYAQQKAASGATTQKYEEVTVGLAMPVAGHFEVRPELRADFSSPSAFHESFDMMTADKGTQVTGLVAGLAYF